MSDELRIKELHQKHELEVRKLEMEKEFKMKQIENEMIKMKYMHEEKMEEIRNRLVEKECEKKRIDSQIEQIKAESIKLKNDFEIKLQRMAFDKEIMMGELEMKHHELKCQFQLKLEELKRK